MFRFGRRPPPISAPADGPLIALRDVIKTYTSAAGDYAALRGISIAIEVGEFVAVVGKSGSGKSTLMNIITGIDQPSSGQVCIGGTLLQHLGEDALAAWRGRTVGVVFQFFQLLPGLSALENVMLPMDFCATYTPSQRRQRAHDLLEQMGLADQARKFPAALSGGQQQRVAIARALANDPPIIVADEPTGNLDSRTAETIFELFGALAAAGKTLLMVTHDQELATRAHRTIQIVDGRIGGVQGVDKQARSIARPSELAVPWISAYAGRSALLEDIEASGPC